MQDLADLRELYARLLADPADAPKDAFGLVVGGGRGLGPPGPPGRGVDEQDVGEGATDVHAETVRHVLFLR